MEIPGEMAGSAGERHQPHREGQPEIRQRAVLPDVSQVEVSES